MGSRSLACALVQHRQAEPRATLRRPWTFDRAGPQLLCMCCVRELPDSYIQGCVHCRASLSAYRAKQGARAGCAHDEGGHSRVTDIQPLHERMFEPKPYFLSTFRDRQVFI